MGPAARLAELFRLGPELLDATVGPAGSTAIFRGTQTALGARVWRLATTSLSGSAGVAIATATPLLVNGISYELRVICPGRAVTNAGNAFSFRRSTGQVSGVEGTDVLSVSGPGVFQTVVVGTATLDTLTIVAGSSSGLSTIGDTWDLDISLRKIL
jgi:hypothetical protein